MNYDFHAMRIQLSLTPAERAAIGAPANHNAAAEVAIVETARTGAVRCLATFFYSWEQGTMTLPQIVAAIRVMAAPLRDTAIAASVPNTTEALIGVRFPV
jgi:hypothetical protein